MTAIDFFVVAVPIPRLTPEQRLAQATDLIRPRLGYVPTCCHVHPDTLEETAAPASVTLVADENRLRFDYGWVKGARP